MLNKTIVNIISKQVYAEYISIRGFISSYDADRITLCIYSTKVSQQLSGIAEVMMQCRLHLMDKNRK